MCKLHTERMQTNRVFSLQKKQCQSHTILWAVSELCLSLPTSHSEWNVRQSKSNQTKKRNYQDVAQLCYANTCGNKRPIGWRKDILNQNRIKVISTCRMVVNTAMANLFGCKYLTLLNSEFLSFQGLILYNLLKVKNEFRVQGDLGGDPFFSKICNNSLDWQTGWQWQSMQIFVRPPGLTKPDRVTWGWRVGGSKMRKGSRQGYHCVLYSSGVGVMWFMAASVVTQF